jgi:hypothetical protein
MIGYVDVGTGSLMNTIEGKWCQVKAFLNPYNWMGLHISTRPQHIRGAVYGR